MPDFAFTFDHWWYFIHRIREGEFPTWNPYSLFGRLNVQWNFIPIFIFTPFLLLGDLTLTGFKNSHILATFLMVLSFYQVGRLNGFSRGLSLIPLSLIVGSTVVNQNVAFLPYLNQYLFFFIGISFITFPILKKKTHSFKDWIFFTFFISLSLLAVRMDILVYNFSFLLLFFFILVLFSKHLNFSRKKIVIYSIASLAVIFLTCVWQLPLILSSVLNSPRVSLKSSINILAEPLFWYFIKVSLLKQSALLISIICYLIKNKLSKIALSFKFQNKFLFQVSVFMVLMLLLVAAHLSIEPFSFYYENQVHFKTSLMYVFYFLISSIILFSPLLLSKKMNLNSFFESCAFIFLGMHIFFELHYLAINFEYRIIGSLILFLTCVSGTYNLCYIKRNFVFPIIVSSFCLIGQTGVFFLHEVLGIPWLPTRSYVFLLPVLSIVMLEGLTVTVKFLYYFIKSKKLYIFPFKFKNFKLIISLCISIFFLFSFDLLFVPNSQATKDQPAIFHSALPYAGLPKSEVFDNAFRKKGFPGGYLEKSFENTMQIRDLIKNDNDHKRVSFNEIIKKVDIKTYNEVFPTVIQKINNFTTYTSDLPMNTVNLLSDLYNNNYPYHPEYTFVNQAFVEYKERYFKKYEIRKNRNFGSTVLLNPGISPEKYYSEILTIKGSNTDRVFLNQDLKLFESVTKEYNFLKEFAEKNIPLNSEGLVTSDHSLEPLKAKNTNSILKYNIAFIKDEPEHVELSVNTNNKAFLTLMDANYKGWDAYVDDKLVSMFNSFIGMRTIIIPEGMHNVKFKFHVIGFKTAVIISSITWLLILILLIKRKGFKNNLHI